MITLPLDAFALALVGAAAIVAAFTLEGHSPLQGWAVACLGTCALVLAMFSNTMGALDLLTAFGVVLFGGIAGAGWNPRGKHALLAVGLIFLIVGLIPRLVAVLALGGPAGVAGTSLPWAVARAAGFVAFSSATGAVLLGTRSPARLLVGGLPARLYALHRALGLTAILAVAVHLISLWLDTFVQFSWVQLLLAPWTASYRPFAITFGFLALLSLVATASSGALRTVVPGWRTVHLLAYATFALGLVHGILAGSDSGSPLAILFYIAALFAVVLTLLRRYLLYPTRRSRAKRGANRR
ncbi:MAG TPA: ferric reductase-like transmembrane domain-containing protein [Rubrobacter sp.]|nr:ferric reductase-like transmembrane domain-containing protein [Rubrobacter sp.]